MVLSKSCEYAIRAVIYIAASSTDGRKVGIAEICSAIEAPDHFTAKILQILSKSKIVSSQKGINGGFCLNSEQMQLRLIDIVKAIDGDNVVTGCALGLKTCSDEKPCPIHNQYRTIRESLKAILEGQTITDLADSLKSGAGFLSTGCQP